MSEIHYRIRRKMDGRFSSGGMCPNFYSKGKTWKTLGHLKNHIRLLSERYRKKYLEECEIVAYFVVKAEYKTSHTMKSVFEDMWLLPTKGRETEKARIERELTESVLSVVSKYNL